MIGLSRSPLLQTALVEAKRFEEKRAMRPAVKTLALVMAWSSVALTVFIAGQSKPILLIAVLSAAVLGTLVVIFVPTDRS